MARKIAMYWTFVLSLPQIEGAKTVFSAATTPRRPRIRSSRPMITAAIQGDTRSTLTSAISAPDTSSLSAVVSRNEPSVVVSDQRRARYPSAKSVKAATANRAAAAVYADLRSGPRRIRAITAGTARMRANVRPESSDLDMVVLAITRPDSARPPPARQLRARAEPGPRQPTPTPRPPPRERG